jgi:hypothetical protein
MEEAPRRIAPAISFFIIHSFLWFKAVVAIHNAAPDVEQHCENGPDWSCGDRLTVDLSIVEIQPTQV